VEQFALLTEFLMLINQYSTILAYKLTLKINMAGCHEGAKTLSVWFDAGWSMQCQRY